MMLTRLRVLLLILLAVVLGANVFLPSVQTPAPPAPQAQPVLAVTQNDTPPTKIEPITTPAPQAIKPPAPSIAPATKKIVATTPVPTRVAPPTPPPTQNEFDLASDILRSAIVNILCVSGRRDIHSISGSGVIIDPHGIIITNAHIAQYFLYQGDKALDVSCVIRTGSPAKNAYKASLVYFPEAWTSANKDILITTNPTGNGEFDFALLAITGSASIPIAPLPKAFQFIPLTMSEPSKALPIVVGSYAAQFLSSSEIQSALYPTIVFGSISDIFTFVKTSIDVFTITGSAAAQEGSSGGGIARVPGELIGIVTTSTTEENTSKRTLAGITIPYIAREYENETGSSLESLFAKSPTEAASDFAPQVNKLRAVLTAALSH
jgi:S1-C subfamily serine protease